MAIHDLARALGWWFYCCHTHEHHRGVALNTCRRRITKEIVAGMHCIHAVKPHPLVCLLSAGSKAAYELPALVCAYGHQEVAFYCSSCNLLLSLAL